MSLSNHQHDDDDSVLMPPPPPKRPRSNCIVDDNDVRPTAITPPNRSSSNDDDSSRRLIHHDNNVLFDDGCAASGSFEFQHDDDDFCDTNDSSHEAMTENAFVGGTESVCCYNNFETRHELQPNEREEEQESRCCCFTPTNETSVEPVITTRFRDVVGHGAAKLRIDELLLPLALPQSVTETVLTGVRALPASILLYGPPGCGKTQLARAIAGEAQAAFVQVGPSDVLSKFVGESEASIRLLFKTAYERARNVESQCAILFFDEIDALGQSRGTSSEPTEAQSSSDSSPCSRQVLAEMLIQFTNLSNGMLEEFALEELRSKNAVARGESNHDSDDSWTDQTPECSSLQQPSTRPVRLIVVAATNRPDDCDAALLRRFGIRVYVGLPSKRDRKKIVVRLLKDIDHDISAPQLEQIAAETQDWSGSDLEALTREAAMTPVRECLRSAALLKAKVHKKEEQQRGGDESAQEQQPAADAHEQASSLLLRGFENLRPVNLQDFERAAEFLLGTQDAQSQSSGGTLGCKRYSQVHYDSSSSSDDEGDD